MYFDKDKCAICHNFGGKPIRHYERAIKSLIKTERGFPRPYPVMVCSDDCYEKATEPFLKTPWPSEWQKSGAYLNRLYAHKRALAQAKYDARNSESESGGLAFVTFNINEGEAAWLETRREAFRAVVEDFYASYVEAFNAHERYLENEKLKERLDQEAEERRKNDITLLALERQDRLLEPKPIPEHLRVHTAIIAKTGWGKTQLLQKLILEILQNLGHSLVVIDSTGAMVKNICRLQNFQYPELRNRLVIVDPAHSPPLNMFDLSNPRFQSYTDEQRESVLTEITQLFTYIFASNEYDLSGQMALAFSYAVRLMLARQGSTLTDLRDLLQDQAKSLGQSQYKRDIENLDPDTQNFFEHQFYTDSLRSTKSSIAKRIHDLINIPAFKRMFSSPANSLDFFQETQTNRSIILVNTSRELLKKDGSSFFARYLVARLMTSLFERASIPRDERRITHLLIDEAAPVFDDTFDDLLTATRQYGLKAAFAFQHLEQLSDKIKNAIAGQTSVKYFGGMSEKDAKWLAGGVRCKPEFLLSLKRDIALPPKWSEFAVYVDDITTEHPFKLKLPFYTLENSDMMSDSAYENLLRDRALRPQTHEPPKEDGNADAEQGSNQQTTPAQLSPTSQAPAPGGSAVKQWARNNAEPTPHEQASTPSNDPHTGDYAKPADRWGNE